MGNQNYLRWLFILIMTFSLFVHAQTAAPIINDEEKLFQQSLQLYTNQQYAESAKILKSLILKNRSKSIYWFNFANCFFMVKQYSIAARYYQHIIKLNTKLVDISKIYLAKTLVAQGRVDEAQNILIEIINGNVGKSLKSLAKSDLDLIQNNIETENQAIELYQNKDWQMAEQRLKQINPEQISTDALILLGLAQLNQNKKREAQKSLIYVYKNKSLTTDKKNTVIDLVKKSRSEESLNNNLWSNLDLALGQTDNVYVDGASIIPISSQVQRINLNSGYHFLKNNSLSYKINYGFNYENYTAASELKYFHHTLGFSLNYTVQSYEIKVAPYFQIQNWNNSQVLTKQGIQNRIALQEAEHEYGVELDFVSKKSSSAENEYLTGSEISLRPFWGAWSNEYYQQISILFYQDNVSDIQYDDGSTLPLKQNAFGLNLKSTWYLNKKNLISAEATYTQKNFTNTSQPLDKKRSDQELSLQFKYNYNILPELSVYAILEHNTNSSSLGSGDVRDKNYRINFFGLGLYWDIFE